MAGARSVIGRREREMMNHIIIAAHPCPAPASNDDDLTRWKAVAMSQLSLYTLHRIGLAADVCPECGESDIMAHLLTDWPADAAVRCRSWGVAPIGAGPWRAPPAPLSPLHAHSVGERRVRSEETAQTLESYLKEISGVSCGAYTMWCSSACHNTIFLSFYGKVNCFVTSRCGLLCTFALLMHYNECFIVVCVCEGAWP